MPITTQGIFYTLSQPKNTQANRPPLIFIHGAGGNLHSWHPHQRRLAGETIYALDLPGHGRSTPSGRQSIEAYANDVDFFLDGLQIAKAILVGLSMGTAIALTLAYTQPHKVQALALFGGGAKLRVAKGTLDTIGNPQLFVATVQQINRACFSRHATETLIRLSEKNMLAVGPTTLLGDYTACNKFDLTSKLGQISQPTLLVCGAEDVMTPPKYSTYLYEHLPNAELNILEGAGHMLPLEQPTQAANLLKKFVDGLSPQP